MNNELSQQILSELKSIKSEIGAVKSELGSMNVRLDNLEQGQARLEEGQARLEQRQDRLEQSQARLEQSQAETNAKLESLTSYVKAIHHHQNEDFALLQAVDEKLTRLSNVSEAHEEKFRKLRML
jgi:chromosome segregation ATPase